MQPYVFPYLGYFQLISTVDKFILYDDVNFIKQGWVNRNYILLNNKKHLFTIPVQHISSNSLISETMVATKPQNWDTKLLKTLHSAYSKAPYFTDIFPIIESVVTKAKDKSISELAIESIESVLKYLSVNTQLFRSSSFKGFSQLKNAERVLNICEREGASHYINPIGGIELYDEVLFLRQGVKISFLRMKMQNYKQFNYDFIDGLSIIDILMFNSKETVTKEFLPLYTLYEK